MTAVTLKPWDDDAALEVFGLLDRADLAEIAAVHGARFWEQVWADWRGGNAFRFLNVLAHDGLGRPFAAIGLSGTGCPGVAAAAMLTVDRGLCRRDLARAVLLIRRALPGYARDHHLRRIECRCWEGHPTARHLLVALGFDLEGRCHGFGPEGATTLLQYAWTPDDTPGDPAETP